MRRKNGFMKFYLGFIAVFFLLLIIGLFVLHSFLKTYEAAQPKSMAQNICDDYIKPGRVIELREKYSFKLSDYESEKSAKEAFDGIIAGKKLEVNYSSRTPKGSDICFYVKAGDKNIMQIALSKNKKSGKFGITGYSVNEISLLDDVYKTVKITFPSNAGLTVNGKPISKDDIKESSLPKIKGVEFGKGTVYTCTAEINNLLNENVTVKATGGDFEIGKSENDISVSQSFDAAFKKEIEEFAVAGAKAYAEYMQDNGSLGQIGKYIDTSSDFYKGIRGTIVSFALNFNSSTYENLECIGFTKHSDEIYSCRVKFVHAMKQGAKLYHDNFDKRIYLRINKDGKKIIDMQSN
ncbi:MAG: hypothetical protein J5662_03165 [Clostridia bacterium]|nr:hypothetical protein [Clostridia bacterium]